MKICCTKAAIATGLGIVGRATSSAQLPILSTIKITTEQGNIKLQV